MRAAQDRGAFFAYMGLLMKTYIQVEKPMYGQNSSNSQELWDPEDAEYDEL